MTKIVHVLAAVFIIANVLPRTTSSTQRIHVENARAVEDFTVIRVPTSVKHLCQQAVKK